MMLRARRPEMKRPFRMWLYPLPPVLALIGFGYILFVRRGSLGEMLLALTVAIAGTVLFIVRSARTSGQARGAYRR
jgi:amino acid transporter